MGKREFGEKARLIWEEIEKAKRVLLCLHASADGDSVGSNLAMKRVLEGMGKKVELISKDEPLKQFSFLSGCGEIKVQNLKEVDLAGWDLLVTIDSAAWYMITGDKEWEPKFEGTRAVVIDHHVTNPGFGDVDLIMPDMGSCSEILYELFGMWEVNFDKETAEALLLGIAADTGVFQYPNTTSRTLQGAADLMDKGGGLERVTFNLLRRNEIGKYKYWGKVLEKMEIDEKGAFVYVGLSQEEVKKLDTLGVGTSEREGAASMFFQSVEGTEFGILFEEDEPGIAKGSLRARTGFDVSEVAVALGGGGHRAAAGFKREFKGSFEEEKEKILEVCREASRRQKKMKAEEKEWLQ